MNTPIIDSVARETAIDPARSFIVQAPAGSGKTELLTQRVLKLLTVVDEPEEILALTFTRKAAGEMRERILKAIETAMGSDRPITSGHQQVTFDLARAVIDRDARLGWCLSEQPNRLRVLTIDAFCGYLARSMPLLSQLGANLMIEMDAKRLYKMAATNVLRSIHENPSEDLLSLLRHLDNNVQTLEQLLIEMLAIRDHWLIYAFQYKNEGFLDAAEWGLRHAVSHQLAQLHAELALVDQSELLWLIRYGALHLSKQDDAYRLLLDLNGLPSTDFDQVNVWRLIVSIFLDSSGKKLRSQARKEVGFPGYSDEKDAEQKAIKKQANERYKVFADTLKSHDSLAHAFVRIASIPDPHYSEDEWHTLQALMSVLLESVAELWLVFQQTNSIDFVQQSAAAQVALGDDDQITDLALYLDYKIKHLLVDEFQDTSTPQHRLLQRLVEHWSVEEGRTLFFVGDPMQSIYRFRQAEVGLFFKVRDEGLANIKLNDVRLQTNFRSQAGVVQWVNSAFAEVFDKHDDIARGAVSYSQSSSFHDDSGQAVYFHSVISHEASAEHDKVLALISDALQNDECKTIAVLARARQHLFGIAQRLQKAGIAFTGLDIQPLTARPAIQDLLSLTRAITNPADRIAWFSILRAPWCGFTLNDLLALSRIHADSVFQALRNPSLATELSSHAQEILPRVVSVLDSALAHYRKIPLRQLLENTWHRIGGPATLEQSSEWDNVNRYLQLLETLDEAGALRVGINLEQQVAEAYASSISGDSASRVQLMTIHKSKGLEFDVVIVPSINRSPQTHTTQLMKWIDMPRIGGEEMDFILAPIKARHEEGNALYSFVGRLEKEKTDQEVRRLLYVAATRARRQLHWVGTAEFNDMGSMKSPRRDSLLSVLWPAVDAEWGSDVSGDAPPRQSLPESSKRIYQRLPTRWSEPEWEGIVSQNPAPLFAQNNERIEFSWATLTAQHVGTVTHRVLQKMAERQSRQQMPDQIPDAELERWIAAELCALGVENDALPKAQAKAAKAIKQTLNDDRGRWILSSHQDAACELALTGMYRDQIVNVVIDRTFVHEGTRWIIDYKTGDHRGADVEAFLDQEQARYRQQLEKYASILSSIDKRPIRLGLYFPLLRGWRTWEAATCP